MQPAFLSRPDLVQNFRKVRQQQPVADIPSEAGGAQVWVKC